MKMSNRDSGELKDIYRSLMKKEGLDDLIIETFIRYLQQVMDGVTGKMSRDSIKPPDRSKLVEFEGLAQSGTNDLDKLVVIKLNGGLGTSMGLKKAKSLLPVKGDLNFLDIIARQTLHLRKRTGKQIPLLFMNSFNTNEDTLRYLKKYGELSLFEVPLSFTQNKYPRIMSDSLKPYSNPADETQNWNPPGHGDIYTAMTISGVLDQLLDSGIQYAFISNSDNLGAIVDERILNHMIAGKIPFLMEVCHRSEIDKKGGHLAQSKDSRLVLREIAQCPDDELEEFQDIGLYSFFNTNNLWIDLLELRKIMKENDDLFMLPIIVNPKKIDGTALLQIESAMGAAIGMFPHSQAIIVPRKRFAPVKKTNDLLTIWSDAYTLKDDYGIELNKESKEIPTVILDERYYQTIDQLQKRVESGIPSLKNCRKLEIIGDIHFGEDVVIKGKAKLEAKQPVFIYGETIEGNLQL